ncbi:Crp/Fnr family transcriptional regulator [Pedobacter antarcticus]|uniref:Crp/Fnr family transcriptional regulator n=1 Tax=Pedobacter antarcticus TaxID=34086 RepID=UPI001C59FC9A|nr:Crp/Fnr family transcriptional regulator [Pedobacter antarcticus]
MKCHQSVSVNELKAFRHGIAAYVNFNDEEWDAVIPFLSSSTIKKKDHFAVNGEVCEHIGFIVEGSVRFYHLKDGAEITGYFCFENEFVSAYKSYLTQQPGITYIQALEETQLVLISYHNMQLMLKHPLLGYKMERFGRLVAEHYLCCYEDRVTSFILQTPEERYLQMLETNGAVLLRIPQHYVANFLGITPVSLSRIRRRTLVHS